MNYRMEGLIAQLPEKKLDAMLVSAPENRRYLSGFTGSAGYLLISEDRAVLVTDSRYSEQAGGQAPDYDVVQSRGGWDWLIELLKETGHKRLGFESQYMASRAASMGVEVTFFQSNVEGHLIDCIQENWGGIQGIIINPGALTHYGYALKDALIDASVPVIEVHLGNPYARETWRRHSVVADIVRGQIAGFGWRSYTAALDIIAAVAKEEENQ